MDASSTRRAEENELLISLIHRKTVIWDQRTNRYKNIDTRQASWMQVAKAMGLDGTERTYTLRDSQALSFLYLSQYLSPL